MTKHLAPADRRQQLLDTARDQAEKSGYLSLTRDGVAQAAGISGALLNYHFGTLDGLRYALMQQAVRAPNLRILAQGVIARHPVAMRAAKELRARALTEYCK